MAEVFIRNVPYQANEKSLNNFFTPVLARLAISDFSCEKRGKYAVLIFLSKEDCLRFLGKHGQITSNGRSFNTPATIQLKLFGMNIYCSASDRKPDPYNLRSLELRRKKLIDSKTDTVSKETTLAVTNSRVFNTRSAACGVWSYEKQSLIFTSHVHWEASGTVKFTSKKVVLEMDSGKRIEFSYSSIKQMAVASVPNPSITMTLSMAPKLTEQHPLADLLRGLSLSQDRKPQKILPVRLGSFGGLHEHLVSSCLVYRITCVGAGFIKDMMSLRRSPEIPKWVHQQTSVRAPLVDWRTEQASLRATLNTPSSKLSFAVVFQLEKLAQNGYLQPSQVMEMIPHVAQMVHRSGDDVSVAALQKFSYQIPFSGPETEADELSYKTLMATLVEYEELAKQEEHLVAQKRASENIAIIHRALVTPAGIYLYGPEPETKNRVLRKYPKHQDYFLRVQFADEDFQPVRYDPTASNDTIFHGRFKQVLTNGFNVAGRKYSFLGFSHSSLRAQTCWSVAPFVWNGELQYDREIIADLGDFSAIRSPAKCAARIGQAFSETPNVVSLDGISVDIIPDVEREGRVFSDGVGTISTEVMTRIWGSLAAKHIVKPSLYQIRQAGAKGMVSLDNRLTGNILTLRPSMIKFPSNEKDIELCGAAYKPLPMYLNRQTIKIMEDLGVEDQAFLDLQAAAVRRLRLTTTSAINAANFLKSHSASEVALLPNLIKKLSSLNLSYQEDQFLNSLVELAVLVELRELKHRSRILVENGVTLYGIMDETGILNEDEIFCIMDTPRGPQKVVTDKLIITRAPALHPGDVRTVMGVAVPKDSPLMALSNCIVFSSKGKRDLPSQLSGGDLDGDLYNLIWDPNLKLKNVHKPADYPRQEPVDIGRQVTRSDMTDFFVTFMATDQLGRIATLHQVLADQHEPGTLSHECIILAEMHSTAVDFSKTGIPVDLAKMPKYSRFRPDFMAPGPHVKIENKDIIFKSDDSFDASEDDDTPTFKFYESDKILGKLYRAIDERDLFANIQKYSKMDELDDLKIMTQAWKYVERCCQGIQWKHLMPWAWEIRNMYEDCLRTIMSDYGHHHRNPLSEIEVVVGNILGRTGAQSRQQRELSTTMKDCYERDVSFTIHSIVKDGTEHRDDALERSIACFAISFDEAQRVGNQEKLRSFMFVAAAVCLREMEGLFG